MKILIVNQPLENRGDESAHRALVKNLLRKLPGADIEVLFVGTNDQSINEFEVADQRVRYCRIPLGRIGFQFLTRALRYKLNELWYVYPTSRKIMNHIKEADLVVCAPGGICMGGFQSWLHISILYMARMLKKKVVYYGRSFGPFPERTKANKRFKQISSELLRYFDFISIRDAATQKLADTMKLDYVSTTDSAFLEEVRGEIPAELKSQIGEGEYVVFVPNVLVWHYRYKTIPREVVKAFFERILNLLLAKYPQAKVVLLPQTSNPLLPVTSEMKFFEELKRAVTEGADRVKVISDKYGSDIQQLIIRGSKLVIGARYHSVVFAINNNIPFIALSYEHKISGLLDILGKTDCMVDITTLFDEPVHVEQALSDIEGQLERAQTDRNAMNTAKQIALSCFDSFVMKVSGK